jgi:antitoxin (DNA-binding transcriptional repressor) of toxin-antitoxin stability system
MKSFGIRRAKAQLSEIVREAAAGKCSLVTDNRKPVAMIGPPSSEATETEAAPRPVDETKPLSDAAAFRAALFSAPYPIELAF